MARTLLFAALRRAFRSSLASSRAPSGFTLADKPGDERAPPAWGGASRRDVLRLGASAAALVLPGTGLAGCDGGEQQQDEDPVIAIVGGGIAGLHCAYRLREAGVQATVYEAQARLGGRMYSARGEFPGDPTQLCELGGELIDSGHLTLHALAEEFDLVLDDRLAGEPPGFKRDTWFVNGAEVAEATLSEQFIQVAPRMAAALQAAEADDAAYTSLDETTLDRWLIDNVPVGEYPELHAVLQTAYRGEYGRENDEQSALNLLYLIGSDDPEPFRIFGVSDERYHAHLGNDSFPARLAERLDAGAIELEHRLVRVKDGETGGRFELTFATPDGEEVVVADHVVFALPFTTLREVDLTALTLSPEKRDIIATLGYGTNAKVMLGFTTRVWKQTHNASGALGTDLGVQQTWETTIGQDGAHGILTNFLGGQAGLASGDGTPEAHAGRVIPDLEQVWPGAEAAFTGTAVRMHWPTVPTMKGSYACYRPGQWAFYGLEGAREGNLHFCGEHCSLDYQGYMEGAAETGAMVAAEILEDLERTLPRGLVRALGIKLLAPQACYRRTASGQLNPLRRRRVARETIARAMARLEAADLPGYVPVRSR